MLEEEYMKYNQNRRIFRAFYATAASMTLLTGFTSLAAEQEGLDTMLSARTQNEASVEQEGTQEEAEIQDDNGADETTWQPVWGFTDMVEEVQADAVDDTKTAAVDARRAYLKKVEEEKKAAQEAARLAAQKAAEKAAKEAEEAKQAAAVSASASEQELLAALIFCEAGNQPYEGQVAVGAVVMNRVRSGSFPDTITDVIYQSGQFTPAMTGWLDSVLASDGYTDSAMQAAADALAGSNPVGDCLYFSTGGGGYQLGDHFFR